MKKIVKSIFMAALSMMVCTSCESYFDSVPSNVVSLDAVFRIEDWHYSGFPTHTLICRMKLARIIRAVMTKQKEFGHLLAWKQSYHGINVILIILI